MSHYRDIPRLFFSLDRTYSYPTLAWEELNGSEVNLESMFLSSGVMVAGKFILRVIASSSHGRVDLLWSSEHVGASWVMLTQDEARLVIATLKAHGVRSEVAVERSSGFLEV